jgi:hypothetical protein
LMAANKVRFCPFFPKDLRYYSLSHFLPWLQTNVALTRAVLHRFLPIGSDRVLFFTPSPCVPLLPSLLSTYLIKSLLKPAQFNPEDWGSLIFRNFDFCPNITR